MRVYEFPADIGLKHDMIDPGQPYQQVGAVYPVLIEMIDPGQPYQQVGAVYPVLIEAVTADEPDWPAQ